MTPRLVVKDMRDLVRCFHRVVNECVYDIWADEISSYQFVKERHKEKRMNDTTNSYIYIYIHMYVYMFTHTHTHTETHTDTHTQT